MKKIFLPVVTLLFATFNIAAQDAAVKNLQSAATKEVKSAE